MNSTVKTIIYIVLAIGFVLLEIDLFDSRGTTNWLPWTLFLVPFSIGLYETGAIQGMLPSNRRIKDTVGEQLPTPVPNGVTSVDTNGQLPTDYSTNYTGRKENEI